MTILINSRRVFSATAKRYAKNENLMKTCLYDFHLKNEGKMVEFAGYEMPIQYKAHSIIDSHNWTRKRCGIFDVSHMLQFRVEGNHREEFMHSLIVADLASLPNDTCTLSLFTNATGGIMDDLIITNCQAANHYYVVSNAGCADKIRAHVLSNLESYKSKGLDVHIKQINNGLIALQGPLMPKVLQPGLKFPLTDLYFGQGKYCSIFGIDECRVTRCGYTGEDGVEISVPTEGAQQLIDKFLLHEDVIPVGLGARDTLRLEAGLCLYGNDIDETTTPSEAALVWTIGKGRRTNSAHKFPGYDVIMGQINKTIPVERRRVGFASKKGPPARSGDEIIYNDTSIGRISSGCFSPYLSHNISMGYLTTNLPNGIKQKDLADLQVRIRGKSYPITISKMPFVPNNYYKQ